MPKATALFTRHASNIGADALRRTRSATIEGTIEMREVGITPSPLRILLAAPHDRLLTIDHGKFGRGLFGFSSAHAWELDVLFEQRILESKVHRELIETQSLHSFADWQTTYAKLRTVGRKRFAGQDCWVVEATSKRGATRTLYFNRESGYLAGHEADDESLVSFADWRSFGAIKFATTIKSIAHDTGHEETRRIASVTFDDVEEGAFQLPAVVTRMLRTPEQLRADNERAKKQFAAYIGSYKRLNTEGRQEPAATISVEDGYLRLTPNPTRSFYFLAPDEKGVFAGRDQPLRLTFKTDDTGKVLGMTLKAGPRSYWFSRNE